MPEPSKGPKPEPIRFTVDGKTFEIEFSRSKREVPTTSKDAPEGKSTWPYTTATILEVGEGKRETWRVFRTFTVGCHKSDRFTYEGGRKRALALAVYDEPYVLNAQKLLVKNENVIPRSWKTVMWKAYHSRPGSRVKLS